MSGPTHSINSKPVSKWLDLCYILRAAIHSVICDWKLAYLEFLESGLCESISQYNLPVLKVGVRTLFGEGLCLHFRQVANSWDPPFWNLALGIAIFGMGHSGGNPYFPRSKVCLYFRLQSEIFQMWRFPCHGYKSGYGWITFSHHNESTQAHFTIMLGSLLKKMSVPCTLVAMEHLKSFSATMFSVYCDGL